MSFSLLVGVHVDRADGADPLTAWFGDGSRPRGIHTQNLAEMTPRGRRAALHSQATAVPPSSQSPPQGYNPRPVGGGRREQQSGAKTLQHLVFNVHVKF